MDLRRILYDEPMLDTSLMDEVPQMGMMTQTVTPSPVVKWILRAQIRNEDTNDIIIVRESSIELKQVVGRGLRTVAVKNDFDASIRAARILGKLKSPPSPHESERIFQERFADSGYTSDGSFMEVDGEKPSTSGPQVLVLSLRCGQASRLMFLSARDDRNGGIQFISSTCALPGHRFDNARPDAHLAIDPQSLALAAAAQNDTLVIGALKPLSQISAEMEARDRASMDAFTPFAEQSIQLPLSAVILGLEFLQPPKDSEFNGIVLLLLIVSAAGQTRIRLFEWDSSSTLYEVRDLWQGAYPIPHYARSTGPSQLIPTANYCGFILTFDKFMLAYTHINNGYNKPLRIEYPREHTEKSQCLYEFGRPGQRRYWTAWARPYRHGGFGDRKQDALYLGREDGLVSFMMFSSETGHSERHELGRVNISIDNGFESLDSGEHAEYNTSDLLLMAGNSSDGGLFQYYPRKMPGLRPSKLRNWTPLLDWTTVPSGAMASSLALCDPLSINAGRIFACAGYGMRHGKLCEIRYGIEAACFSEISLNVLSVSRPTRVWLLPGDLTSRPIKTPNQNSKNGQNNGPSSSTGPRFALLLSSPGSGSEMVVVDEQGQFVEAQPESRIEMLIDIEAETLCASLTADDLAVQITDGSVRVASLCDTRSGDRITAQDTPAPITRAYIDGRTSTCLISLRMSESSEVHCLRVLPGEAAPQISSLGKITTDELDPGVSSISLHTVGECQIAIIGTATGKLKLYHVGDSGILPVAEHQFEGELAICESICCLQWCGNGSPSPEAVVLCGLRNGSLQVLRFQNGDVPSIGLQRELQIGHSAAWVFPEFTSNLNSAFDPSAAIVVCQDMLFRLTVRNRECSRLSLNRIWTCHPDTRCVPPSPIFAFGQSSSWLGRRKPSGLMCYVDDKTVRVFNVEQSRFASMIPRPIGVSGTPRRVLYATSINKLVVACEELVVITSRSNGSEKNTGGCQFIFSKLQVIDLDSERDAFQNADEINVGLSGDRITALLEWNPELNGRRWPLLVVTSMRKEQEGSIYIYRMDRQTDGNSLKLLKEIPRGAPVHSVVAFGATRLAYGCGNRLEVIELTTSEKGFSCSQPAHLQVQLDSPARSLSTHDDEIFVSTTEHSHQVCALVGGKLTTLFTDYKIRHGLDHMYLGPEPGLLIGSDSHGGVCGFWWADNKTSESKMRPVFEVGLLDPITRLCRGNGPHAQRIASGTGVTPVMLGVSIGGAIYSFDTVASHHWRLLRFVQNVLDRQPEICPATYMDNDQRHVDPGIGPEHKHINGDILRRLLEQPPNGAEFLRTVMEAPPGRSSGSIFSTDFPTAEKRVEHFRTLIHEAFSEASQQDPYALVVSYLERILRSVD